MTAYCLLEPAYLAVPPVIDDADAIFDWLDALRHFGRIAREDFRRFLLKPSGVLDALDASKRRANIPEISALLRNNGLFEEFSAGDVMRTVSHILDGLSELDEVFPGGSLWEITDIKPTLASTTDKSLSECLMQTLGKVSQLVNDNPKDQFVVATLGNAATQMDLHGRALVSTQDPSTGVTTEKIEAVSCTLKLAANWLGFLKAIDAYHHWCNGKEAVVLELSVLARATQLSGHSYSVSFGPNFWDSLRQNGAWPDGPFTHVTFAACADVLANRPTIDIEPFHGGVREKTNSSQLARKDGYLAWRAQITKHTPPLRLMFWRNDESHIELARIGPKEELRI